MDASAVNAAAQAAISEWVDDDSDESGEPQEAEQQQAPQTENSESDDASREEEGQGAEEKEGPDWYHKRLSVVTAKRREAESAREAAEKRVADLEAKLAAKSEPESLFDDEDESEDSSEAKKLRARLEAIEKKEAEREFDRTISAARAKYPELPDVVLFSAMANGVDIDDAATAFQTQLEAIVEARIAKKAKAAGSTPAKPPVSVGGKASGGAGSESKPKAGDGKKRAVDVRSIARKLMDDIMGEDD